MVWGGSSLIKGRQNLEQPGERAEFKPYKGNEIQPEHTTRGNLCPVPKINLSKKKEFNIEMTLRSPCSLQLGRLGLEFWLTMNYVQWNVL